MIKSALTLAVVAASTLAAAQETGDPEIRSHRPDFDKPKLCEWTSRTELLCEDGAVLDDEARATGVTEARASAARGNYAEAAVILGQVVDESTDDVSALTLYGEVLLASGDAKGSVPILRRAISVDPEKPRLHFQLASALTALGKTDDALEAFAAELAINDQPDVRFLAYMNRSILLRGVGRTAEAAEALEEALALDPGSHPQAYGELATLYLSADEPAKALDALERGVEHGFESAPLYFNLGARLFNDRSYADAETAFSRSLQIDPTMADAERSLAATLSQLGRDAEARKHLTRYLELEPDAPDADEVRSHLAASND